jgi:hemerythrin superfamily protein
MLMEVFDRIREEHRRILATMDDLIGSEPEKRKDEINSLAMQIIAHMDAEERTIYKAFSTRRHSETAGAATPRGAPDSEAPGGRAEG